MAVLAFVGLVAFFAGTRASEAAGGPSISRGTFLGNYEVDDVIQTDRKSNIQSFCKSVPEDIHASQHCGKQIWAVLGPKQLALLEAPNMALKDYSRIDAFAIMGDPFCVMNCRWQDSFTYGEIRRTLFSSSSMVRGFHVREDAQVAVPYVGDELKNHEVYFFHVGMDGAAINALESPSNLQVGRAAEEAAASFLAKELPISSASMWRVLLPKDFNKQSPISIPRRILLRETYTLTVLGARIEVHREYVLLRKGS